MNAAHLATVLLATGSFGDSAPVGGYARVAPGQLVRVTVFAAEGGERTVHEGRVGGVRPGAFLLASPGRTEQEYAYGEIDRLEVGDRTGSFAGPGVLFGMIGGGLLVGITTESESPRHPVAGVAEAMAVIGGALLGAVVGGIVGSQIDIIEWNPVRLTAGETLVGPSSPRGLAVSVGF